MKKNFKDLSLPNEIWKSAKGFSSRYYVSNMGRILTTRHHNGYRTAVMKPALDPDGYYRTVMDGRTVKVARVVAQTWLDNPNNLPVVNHKDFNRTNNKIENLEWETMKGNGIHAYKAGRLHGLGIGDSAYVSKYKDQTIRDIIGWWEKHTEDVPLKANRVRHGLYNDLAKIYPNIPLKVLQTICQKGWKYRPTAFGVIKSMNDFK